MCKKLISKKTLIDFLRKPTNKFGSDGFLIRGFGGDSENSSMIHLQKDNIDFYLEGLSGEGVV